MTEEKKYFTYIDTVTGNKDMEKIIIDGVNVAKCKYYHYKGCTANNFGKCDSCSEIYKNCYYKQLQRLKQENEQLTFKLNLAQADYEASEQENAVLQAYKDVNEDFKKAWEEIKDKYFDYKTALEEIKIIADDTFQVCDDDCGNARKIKLIIDKINEVLQ